MSTKKKVKKTKKKAIPSPLKDLSKKSSLPTSIIHDDEPRQAGTKMYGGDVLPPIRLASKSTDELLREVLTRRLGYVPHTGDVVELKLWVGGKAKGTVFKKKSKV